MGERKRNRKCVWEEGGEGNTERLKEREWSGEERERERERERESKRERERNLLIRETEKYSASSGFKVLYIGLQKNTLSSK